MVDTRRSGAGFSNSQFINRLGFEGVIIACSGSTWVYTLLYCSIFLGDKLRERERERGRERMRNKQRKSYSYCSDAGSKWSLSFTVWGLVGCLLMIHFYSIIHHKDKKENKVRLSYHTIIEELEEIEEENFQIPPHRKKGSHRYARRGSRKPPAGVEEFLDESSDLRPFFFPSGISAIDPRKRGNDSMYFYPARTWLDTEGNPIQAHGGGILFDAKSGTYYWYGENKDGDTYHSHKKGAARGFHVYSASTYGLMIYGLGGKDRTL